MTIRHPLFDMPEVVILLGNKVETWIIHSLKTRYLLLQHRLYSHKAIISHGITKIHASHSGWQMHKYTNLQTHKHTNIQTYKHTNMIAYYKWSNNKQTYPLTNALHVIHLSDVIKTWSILRNIVWSIIEEQRRKNKPRYYAGVEVFVPICDDLWAVEAW